MAVALLVMTGCAEAERDASVATTLPDPTASSSGPSSSAPSPTDPTDPTDPTAATDTTAAVDTSAAPSTSAPSPSTTAPFADPTVAAGPCALTAPGSSITYVVDEQVLELTLGATAATCLATLGGPPSGPLHWSPAGDQVLVGAEVVVGADGPRPTGFAADRSVRWSSPTGSALIGSSASPSGTGSLEWRNSRDANERRDVGFLADTDLAVYHPAGKHIFATGTSADGVAGLFLASNRGEDARPIATLDDPSTRITEIVPDNSGGLVLFVHDHGDMWEVHGLGLPDLGLFDLHRSEEPLGDLLRSPFGSRTVVRQGDCTGPTAIVDIGTGGTPLLLSGPNANVRLLDTALDSSSVRPLGFLDEDRLVVAVRDAGCDGPADIWVVNMSPNPSPDGLAGLTAVQVLESVESVAVRSVLTNWGEIPGDVINQAPG